MKNFLLIIFFIFVFSLHSEEISLTVYSSADPSSFNPKTFISQQKRGSNFVRQVPGYGIVKEEREILFKKGINDLLYTDVAEHIDPTTVSFEGSQETEILEQNFEFDLVNAEKLLKRYVGKKITIGFTDKKDQEVSLLSYFNYGGMVVDTPEGLQILNDRPERIKLENLSKDLVTKPTLSWKVYSKREGKRKVKTSYQTGGLTWRADYNLILNDKDSKASIGSWVSLMNLSGKTYKDTRLKLVAGDVQRVVRRQPYLDRSFAAEAKVVSTGGFKEKSFFEYHLYTLGRKTDLPQNSIKQIALFDKKENVPVKKTFIYFGAGESVRWLSGRGYNDRSLGTYSNKKVDIFLGFENKKENSLGIPFPAGKVRVYKEDKENGGVEFVGEDVIDHIPKDEEVLIRLGSAFDIIGERKQTDFFIDNNRDIIKESFEIIIKNHKEEKVKVVIKEKLFRYANWKILSSNETYNKKSSNIIHFPVEIDANSKKKITYSVKYWW